MQMLEASNVFVVRRKKQLFKQMIRDHTINIIFTHEFQDDFDELNEMCMI